MLKLFLILIAFSLLNFCLSQDDFPEVDTLSGKVRGYWSATRKSRKIAVFEGIPFAKPPLGDLRFEEPQPLTSWLGTWEAQTPRICVQTGKSTEGLPTGSEDCLYLNVYVPAEFLNSSKNLDVIVAIHGGAFSVGFPHLTRPEIMLDNDVILVSNGYRLGLFGFLSTEDDVIPGNNGLKDQSLGLKWVKDNIASFGGNPDSITITGLSAGAASVHLHYFSPWSKGLFNKGMSNSGTAIASWTVRKNALDNAKKLAVLVGCPDHPTQELKECLKQRPTDVLAKMTSQFYGYDSLPLTPFGPVIEVGSSNPFLDEDPYLLLKEGKVLDVPWISSHASEEGWLIAIYYVSDLERLNQDWDEEFPYFLDCNGTVPENQKTTIAKEILEHYLGPNEQITMDNIRDFVQIFTDKAFAIPGELSAKMQANVTKSPVYYYVYDYRDGENQAIGSYVPNTTIRGVAHGDDAIYLYGTFVTKPFSEEDEQLVNACQNMLMSYASTGIPSFDGSDKWQPTGSSEFTYLYIPTPDNMNLKTVEKLTSTDFWKDIGLLDNDTMIAH